MARAAAVARGAIAGASALLSSFEASSAVTLSSRDWMAVALLPEAAPPGPLLERREGQLPCGDVRAVSHLSVVQDLRDVARDWSFIRLLFWCKKALKTVKSEESVFCKWDARASKFAGFRGKRAPDNHFAQFSAFGPEKRQIPGAPVPERTRFLASLNQ